MFKVMLLQRFVDHLCSLVLARQHYTFVHVAVVVAQVHTDSYDAGVGHLSVVDGQRGHGHRALV